MKNLDEIKFLFERKEEETFQEYSDRKEKERSVSSSCNHKGGGILNESVSKKSTSERPNFISEIKGSTTNTWSLHRLDEMTVQRLLGKHSNNGYIIISASRGVENEWNEQQKQEQRRLNNENYQKLLASIKNSGFSFIPVYGGFVENLGEEDERQVYEKSFIVLNFNRKGNEMDFNELYQKGLEWTEEFDQDSFLSKAPDSTPEYVDKGGNVTMKFGGDIKVNDLTQQYFTDFVKSKQLGQETNTKGDSMSREHRITFEGVFINPEPATLSERVVRDYLNELFLK